MQGVGVSVHAANRTQKILNRETCEYAKVRMEKDLLVLLGRKTNVQFFVKVRKDRNSPV